MKRIFILEDMEIRLNLFKEWYSDCELVMATNAQDAIAILEKDLDFKVLFLDHDLGDRIFVSTDDENTGSRVAAFLHDKEYRGMIIIHSWNPAGVKNMLMYLPGAHYVPFTTKEAFDNILVSG